jgi:hypothetical protein
LNPQEINEHERNEVTFWAAPLDGGYADTALHDLVELGLDVQLRVLRLDAFQLDRHWKYLGVISRKKQTNKMVPVPVRSVTLIRIRMKPGQWIRIRIRNPDLGEQKYLTKLEFFLEISYFSVLNVLFWELKASSVVTWTSFMEA